MTPVARGGWKQRVLTTGVVFSNLHSASHLLVKTYKSAFSVQPRDTVKSNPGIRLQETHDPETETQSPCELVQISQVLQVGKFNWHIGKCEIARQLLILWRVRAVSNLGYSTHPSLLTPPWHGNIATTATSTQIWYHQDALSTLYLSFQRSCFFVNCLTQWQWGFWSHKTHYKWHHRDK